MTEQITGRLTKEERSEFGNYAERLGLDGGTVATLLLARELRVERLATIRLVPEFRAPSTTPATITTHRFPKSEKERFVNYVESLGLSQSKALGLLCRAELAELWLEQVITRE